MTDWRFEFVVLAAAVVVVVGLAVGDEVDSVAVMAVVDDTRFVVGHTVAVAAEWAAFEI